MSGLSLFCVIPLRFNNDEDTFNRPSRKKRLKPFDIGRKNVTTGSNRRYQFRSFRILLYLPSEAHHLDIDTPVEGNIIVRPQ